jgi:hypothetical protein
MLSDALIAIFSFLPMAAVPLAFGFFFIRALAMNRKDKKLPLKFQNNHIRFGYQLESPGTFSFSINRENLTDPQKRFVRSDITQLLLSPVETDSAQKQRERLRQDLNLDQSLLEYFLHSGNLSRAELVEALDSCRRFRIMRGDNNIDLRLYEYLMGDRDWLYKNLVLYKKFAPILQRIELFNRSLWSVRNLAHVIAHPLWKADPALFLGHFRDIWKPQQFAKFLRKYRQTIHRNSGKHWQEVLTYYLSLGPEEEWDPNIPRRPWVFEELDANIKLDKQTLHQLSDYLLRWKSWTWQKPILNILAQESVSTVFQDQRAWASGPLTRITLSHIKRYPNYMNLAVLAQKKEDSTEAMNLFDALSSEYEKLEGGMSIEDEAGELSSED